MPYIRLPSGTWDDRAIFFSEFCSRLEVDHSYDTCDKYSYPAPGTVQLKTVLPVAQSGNSSKLVVVFVPGVFGECVKHLATPFSDDYNGLRRKGYRVIVGDSEGRSSSERNAELLDRQLRREIRPDERVILVGYSKGTPDTLVALSEYSENPWVKSTIAFVSVDGVVQGTPLADDFLSLYDELQKTINPSFCPNGDGKVLESMTYAIRKAWISAHKLPTHIQYFSITSIAQAGQVNPLLDPFFRTLKKTSRNNDGQMIVEDSILPNSRVLAVLKGDHWSIALPFETSSDPRARLFSVKNHFPRKALIETTLAYIGELTK